MTALTELGRMVGRRQLSRIKSALDRFDDAHDKNDKDKLAPAAGSFGAPTDSLAPSPWTYAKAVGGDVVADVAGGALAGGAASALGVSHPEMVGFGTATGLGAAVTENALHGASLDADEATNPRRPSEAYSGLKTQTGPALAGLATGAGLYGLARLAGAALPEGMPRTIVEKGVGPAAALAGGMGVYLRARDAGDPYLKRRRHEEAEKTARDATVGDLAEKLADDYQNALFGSTPSGREFYIPSVPVDAFNQEVWNSVAPPNPYGTKSMWGDNSQPLGTDPNAAAMVTALTLDASRRASASTVSPFQLGLAAATGAGTGYAAGMLAGHVLGGLASLTPDARSTLRQAGLWGGLINGVGRLLLGN